MNPSQLAKIATYYINDKGDRVSNKKLQKILYYVEAWNMVHFGTPLIKEDFEAWVHGPVLPSLYRELKELGYNDLSIIDNENGSVDSRINEIAKINQLSNDQLDLIYSVLNKYGGLSAFQLEMLTHSESPWIEARGNKAPHESCNTVIPKSRMKEFYSSLIAS